MSKVLEFPRVGTNSGAAFQSILKFSSNILWQVFVKPIEDAQREEARELRKKILFLERETYKEIFNQCLEHHQKRIGDSVDIAAWKYADRDAQFYAKKFVSEVVAKNQVDKCYKARIKELRG